ncbi:NAD(P)/FAD-dependent oxidoreductase [Megamonas hypermegale]|uniref:NAD(P)/FAD-dependent oxidoreductase n=1 Tax=Megamonas hypermegale TaxID=158847 RepID=UPI0026EC8F10|nr:hypothetical protein [Megamonas hypermegale]
MIRIKNFNVPFNDVSPIDVLAAKRLKLPPQAISEVVIVRKGIDARRYKGAPINYVYILDVKVNIAEKKVLAKLKHDKNVELVQVKKAEKIKPVKVNRHRPIVVGFGPAGMFCALTLAQNGYSPLIFERGCDVDTRYRDIENFWQSGELKENSNVQFGEGGAGTFSDGKLTTRINDSKISDVLCAFVEAGAPPEIKYLHKPHIGTDILRTVVKNIRKKIISLGGEIHFNSLVTDVIIKNGKVAGIEINHADKYDCSEVFFGIGHSARDTYKMLFDKGLSMQAKPFAVGVRIEHPQSLIDKAQYGTDAGSPLLPVADYALTYNNKQKGRSVYSFCMCPGGQVVAAASETGRVVVNGMSNYQRDSGTANSALLVNVTPDDFGHNVLDGIAFQRRYEELAFICGGRNYHAPVQTVGDFLQNKTGSDNFLTEPTYRPGITLCNLHDCLPDFTAQMLAEALPYFDGKIHGFADERAVMTGVEMRSSAPCRIVRNRDSYMSVNVAGFYPIGEGAGYAGGIMSAAVDGVNAAYAYLTEEN